MIIVDQLDSLVGNVASALSKPEGNQYTYLTY